MKAHDMHTGLVVFATLGGLALVVVGAVRLMLPIRLGSPYTLQQLRTTYGLMIAMGAILAGIAVGWRLAR